MDGWEGRLHFVLLNTVGLFFSPNPALRWNVLSYFKDFINEKDAKITFFFFFCQIVTRQAVPVATKATIKEDWELSRTSLTAKMLKCN